MDPEEIVKRMGNLKLSMRTMEDPLSISEDQTKYGQ